MASGANLFEKREFTKSIDKTKENHTFAPKMAPKMRQDGHKTAPRLLLAALGPLLAALGLLLAALRWLMVTLEPLLAALGSLLVPLGPLLVPLGPLLGRTRPAAPNLTRPALKRFKSSHGSIAI